jgi:hypothetical protein
MPGGTTYSVKLVEIALMQLSIRYGNMDRNDDVNVNEVVTETDHKNYQNKKQSYDTHRPPCALHRDGVSPLTTSRHCNLLLESSGYGVEE